MAAMTPAEPVWIAQDQAASRLSCSALNRCSGSASSW
jgi:hypothetical protein